MSSRNGALAASLRSSSGHLSELPLDGVSVPACLVDAEGRLVAANTAAADWLGYCHDELLALRVAQIFLEISPESFRTKVEAVRGRGLAILPWRHRRGDGSVGEAQVALAQVFDGERPLLLVLEVDPSRSAGAAPAVSPEQPAEQDPRRPSLVGDSLVMREIWRLVRRVATTDASVLILGETGSGKELVAHAIHRLSPRHRGPMVRLNCANFSPTLVESELFGYERGAFTGAAGRKLGSFETAHGGTLTLDEIGELPLELQPKLLRVLQDGEFFRVGGTRPVRADVRLVSMTNRDLQQEARCGRFRSDLFHRLNVVPLRLPPLRDRRGDIVPLAEHFWRRFAGGAAPPLPTRVVAALLAHDWPGNVRELENLMQRAAILGDSVFLELGSAQGPSAEGAFPSLAEVQRRHIVSALEATGWRVSGERGAARLLGLKPTTLESRMKKLELRRPR